MSNRPVRLPAAPTAARAVPGAPQDALDTCLEQVWSVAAENGRRAGGDEALRSAAAALERARASFDEARSSLADEAVQDVVWLAVEIASHLVRGEIDAGRYDLERIVRDVLEAADVGRAACTLHLHPEDAKALGSVPLRAGTAIEEDVEVARGDVHVTTPHGVMSRQLEEASASIREAILSQLR